MKNPMKWFAGIIAGVLVLMIAAGIAVMLIVDKSFVEDQMSKALSRHVTVGDIETGIFSAVSGIEVRNVRISDFKTKKQLLALKGRPVGSDDLFAGMKTFNFKISLLPLTRLNIVLKELVLYEPVINIVKYKNGRFNISDLMQPEKLSNKEKARLERLRKEEALKGKGRSITAKDIPFALSIGKAGIDKGRITFTDRSLAQKIEIYDLTALVDSIEIDPENLKNKNSAGVEFQAGIKTVGKGRGRSVESFDLRFAAEGKVKPFDLKSGKPDPEIFLKAGMPRGSISGLLIFEKLESVDKLSKYCGKLSFMKNTLKWKNAFVNIWYKSGNVKLKNGRVKTNDYTAQFSGSTNINTKSVNLKLDTVLDNRHKNSIRSGINNNVKKLIKGKIAGYVKPGHVTDTAIRPFLNKDGNVCMKYQVTGYTDNPDVRLLYPVLPSLSELVKNAAGNMGAGIKSSAKEKVQQKKQKAVDSAGKKSKESAKKGIKKIKKMW